MEREQPHPHERRRAATRRGRLVPCRRDKGGPALVALAGGADGDVVSSPAAAAGPETVPDATLLDAYSRAVISRRPLV